MKNFLQQFKREKKNSKVKKVLFRKKKRADIPKNRFTLFDGELYFKIKK